MRAAGIVLAVSLVASGCLLILPLDRPNESGSSATTTSSGPVGAAGAGGSTGTGTGGAGGSGPVGGCNPACGENDIPSMCKAGTCVQLTSPECLVVHGNWRDPNAAYVGSYTLVPPTDPEGSTTTWDYELAIEELSDKGGLPDVNGVKHPLVVVVCSNDAATPGTDTLPKSLNHLVDDLDVPAIVADLTPANLVRAFGATAAKGKQVFFLSPGTATKELAMLQSEGLVWHMTGSPRDLGPAYQSLVRRVEQFIRQDPAPLRVAVVTTSDSADPTAATLGELFEAVRPLLQFNSMDRAANEQAGNYREFVVDAAHPPTTVSVDIVKYEPHIVISMIGSLFTEAGAAANEATGVMAAMEQTLGPSRVRPTYVLNPINAARVDSIQQIMTGFFQFFPTIYQRFIGINIAGADDPRLYNEYWLRLQKRFPKALPHTENYYDPLYYLAYSMYIAGVEHPLDGAQIRAGMARLLLGKQFDVGPDPIVDILGALGDRQSSIQLRGTMGLPFFESGARKGRGALYCFSGPQSPRTQEQVYDPDTQAWSGTFGCFPNFPN